MRVQGNETGKPLALKPAPLGDIGCHEVEHFGSFLVQGKSDNGNELWFMLQEQHQAGLASLVCSFAGDGHHFCCKIKAQGLWDGKGF